MKLQDWIEVSSRPIEGYFLVTTDNLVFEVKEVLQPAERLIAYLRYAPDSSGERCLYDGTRLSKMVDLKDREAYLRSMAPEYIWLDSSKGREIESVPNERIAYLLDPVDSLKELRDMGSHLDNLQQTSVDLARLLVEESKIDWSDVGITGSQLVGLHTEKSDVDLVVYGESPARRVYQTLKRHSASLAEVESYSGCALDQHTRFRWGGVPQFLDLLRERENRKVLQGLFRGYEFFVRVVKLPEEMMIVYGDVVCHHMGEIEAVCRIVDDRDSIFTPAEYDVSSESMSGLVKVVSYRGRFTEHAHTGERVRIRGRLEEVTLVSSGKKYQQVVLGEKPSDYMVPV